MPAITKDPETMHGVPVFQGGETLEDFLEGFPTVSRALAWQALEEAKQLLMARA